MIDVWTRERGSLTYTSVQYPANRRAWRLLWQRARMHRKKMSVMWRWPGDTMLRPLL